MRVFSFLTLRRIGLCLALPVVLAGCAPYPGPGYDDCCRSSRTEISTGVMIGTGSYYRPRPVDRFRPGPYYYNRVERDNDRGPIRPDRPRPDRPGPDRPGPDRGAQQSPYRPAPGAQENRNRDGRPWDNAIPRPGRPQVDRPSRPDGMQENRSRDGRPWDTARPRPDRGQADRPSRGERPDNGAGRDTRPSRNDGQERPVWPVQP